MKSPNMLIQRCNGRVKKTRTGEQRTGHENEGNHLKNLLIQ